MTNCPSAESAAYSTRQIRSRSLRSSKVSAPCGSLGPIPISSSRRQNRPLDRGGPTRRLARSLDPPIHTILQRSGEIAVKATLCAVVVTFCALVLPVSAQAVIQHYQLNIPRQPLDAALKDFAHQTGL